MSILWNHTALNVIRALTLKKDLEAATLNPAQMVNTDHHQIKWTHRILVP